MCANASGLSSVIVYRYSILSKLSLAIRSCTRLASLLQDVKKPKTKQTNQQKQNFTATREIPRGPGQSKVRRRVQSSAERDAELL